MKYLFENFVAFFADIHKKYICVLYNKEDFKTRRTEILSDQRFLSMKKLTKIISILLALLLLGTSLVGCSSQTKQEQTVIGTCAGFDVLYEELRYVTLTYKDILEASYGEGIWDDPATAEAHREDLETIVWSMMLNNYAVLATCLEYGMTRESMFSDAINEAVEQQVKDTIDEYGSKSAFREDLKKMHMTENFLRFCLRVAYLENELKYILTNDLGFIETDPRPFLEWLRDGNCVYVQHIQIKNDPGDDVEANRAKAEEIRGQILRGEARIEDFVGTKINEDVKNITPYFLVRDVYVEELENAAFSLYASGDVSEVIDTGDSFYLLVRMDYEETELERQAPDLLSSYQWAIAEEISMSKKEELKIELNEYGKTIDLLAIR